MKKLFTITLTILSISCFAQEGAPSLSFGLDQVLFGKGTLDVELIADIVAEKQDELKKRIVEQEVLKPIFKEASFTTTNYVFLMIKNLMYEKDKNVLKKELMEHTANYALIYTLAEMYVQNRWTNLKEDNYINTLNINDYTLEIQNSFASYSENEFPKFKLSLTRCALFEQIASSKTKPIHFNDLLLDMILHATRNNAVFVKRGFTNKPFYFSLEQYKTMSLYQALDKNSSLKLNMYNDVKQFVDDVAKNAEIFEELLAYLNSYDSQLTNQTNNLETFKEILNHKKKELLNLVITNSNFNINEEISSTESHVKNLLNELKNDTKTFLASINQQNLTIAEFDENIVQQLLKLTEKIEDTANRNVLLKDLGLIKQKIDLYQLTVGNLTDLKKRFENLSLAIKNKELKKIESEYVQKIFDDISGIHLESNDSILLKYMPDLVRIYYSYSNYPKSIDRNWLIKRLESEIIPAIMSSNALIGNNKIKVLITDLDILTKTLRCYILEDVTKSMSGKGQVFDKMLSPESREVTQLFLGFFSRLDQLDKTETYYYLLKNLAMAGEHLKNRNAANALNLIVNSMEKYTQFDPIDDKVTLDVELIIQALYNKYGNRDKNPFNFYLTVGLNNTFALYQNSLIDADNNPVRNFTYASEKIGLRFNLINFARTHSYAYREEGRLRTFDNKKTNYKPEPVVSNWHALLFGSGLLYQLTDLSTEKNLNTSFLGIGTGVTFYNNLSFNTSLLFPIKQDEAFAFKQPVLNIGFDIAFTEYLSALSKRRQEQKKAKLELEKLKIEHSK